MVLLNSTKLKILTQPDCDKMIVKYNMTVGFVVQ